MTESPSDRITLLQQAISTLQAQRAILGDAVVDASLVALREQLAQTEAILPQPEDTSSIKLATCLAAKLGTQDPNADRGLRVLGYGFNLLAEIVRQFDGTIQEVEGNCMIGVFSGAADDPKRAAHAALQMRQRVYDYARELEQSGQGSINFRCGLNIGMLAMGAPAGSADGETTTIAVAEVLAQAAPLNTILVSQQFQTYLGDDFSLLAAAPVEVFRRRVPTFTLSDTRQVVQAVQVHNAVLPELPFVGRSDAMRTILRQIEQFSAGSVIVISGESGVGKSRLIDEVHRAAPMLQWLTTYCDSTTIRPVYLAWNTLLLGLIGAKLTHNKKEVEKRLREWMTEHGIPPNFYVPLADQIGLELAKDAPPEGMARQMLESWQTVLSVLVRQRPTVIVFEEAQAMDSASLALLEKMIALLHSLPICWMLITQPLYNQPAAGAVFRLGQLSGAKFTYLGLEPIDADKTQTMLYSLIGVKSLPDPLEAGIMERAQGNPLFLQHIIRALIEKRGLICDPKGRWMATAAALQEYMPNVMRDVVLQRIRMLPEEGQQLLQWAAVSGDTLFPVVLKTLPTNLLGPNLSMLHDSGLVDREPQFLHPTVRDAVYQTMPPQQRAAMHRQVASALLANCELEGPWLAWRAYHMDRGLQTQSALEAYETAKDWALANNALKEVSAIIDAMLELLNERDTPDQVANLFTEQQDILFQLNPDDPRCKTLLERAYRLWIELGNTSGAASALLRMAVHHPGTLHEDQYYREAQNLLERENPRHQMLPDVYLRRALFVAEQDQLDHDQSAEQLFERARTLALQLHDIARLAQIHFEMGLYLRENHRLSEALIAFQQALSYFGQLENTASDERVLTCNYLADLYYHLGQPAKGEYFALEAVAGVPWTSDFIHVLPFVTLSECYAAQARWPEATQTINDAAPDLAPPDMPLRFWLGRWRFEEGDTLEGLELMRESVPAENLECMMLFIDYLLDGDFVEEASLRLHQLVKAGRFSEETATTIPVQAYYDRLRGRLAVANKDYGRAASLLDRAMHQFAREGYVLLQIATRRIYAVTLLARCGPGDEQAARVLLEEAIAACRKLSIHAENRRLQNLYRAQWPDSWPLGGPL